MSSSFRRIDSRSGERRAASTVLTSVKCVCSRATQQESYGQGSTYLALVTQSARYAAQQRSPSPSVSCFFYFNIVAELASHLFFHSSPSTLFGCLHFFVCPLIEASSPPSHPPGELSSTRIFPPLLRGCSSWSHCTQCSGPVVVVGILKLRVDYPKLLRMIPDSLS